MGWPGDLVEADKGAARPTDRISARFVPRTVLRAAAELQWLCITDPHSWEACSVRVRAPIGLAADLLARDQPEDLTARGLTLQAVQPPRGLLEVAARDAFRGLALPLLKKLCLFLGVEVAPAASLFDTLFGLVQHVTRETDSEVLAILSLRFSEEQINVQELLGIGDALEVVPKAEATEFAKEVRAQEAATALASEYEAAFFLKKRSLIPAVVGKKAKCKAAAKSGPGAARRLWAEGKYSQKDVQALVPPGAHSWRASAGAWHVHLPPYPRKSRAWGIEGEEAAAKFILQYAWTLYMRDAGGSAKECPVLGLF